MRDKTYHIYLDSPERKLLIHSLVELKNQLIQQGRYTDCVDELVFKVKVKSFAPRQIQRRLLAALVTLSRKVF